MGTGLQFDRKQLQVHTGFTLVARWKMVRPEAGWTNLTG
jgi:hypothetical protein